MSLSFQRLTVDWNAEPNAPEPQVLVEGVVLRLRFLLNPFAFVAEEGEVGVLHFDGCSHWRMDSTNDHGWYAGRGRYAGVAPDWGEFYEVSGDGTLDALDWQAGPCRATGPRHFLFYFRDECFECRAAGFRLTRSMAST